VRPSLKRILIVLTVLLIVIVVVYRQRLFLRDPLGKVELNGIGVEGASVFINYYNEVLIRGMDDAGTYLVQRGGVPGTPAKLNCVQGMVCWTEADIAKVAPLGGVGYQPNLVMSDKEVSFQNGEGDGVRVVLR
jgi:hypothetical protein